MGTDKRARQKELGRTRADQARQQAEAAARRRRLTRLSLLVGGVIVATVLSLYFTSDEKSSTTAESSTSTTTTRAGDTSSTTADTAQPAELKGPPPGATITGKTPCPKADGSSPRTTKFAEAPPMCIDTKKTYVANFTTSKGKFSVTLDAAKAPKATNNFVVLSRYHFYDGIQFHRIIDDFMFQGGDPSDPPKGSGGPGYEFGGELPKAGEYQVGSIAMANSGPKTDGSQFFVITGKQGVGLPPDYSLFGKVSSGMDVVDAIGKTPNLGGQSGTPLEAVTINSITITES